MTITDFSGAIFSPCRKYRYLLWRELGQGEGTLTFLCCNGSTAGERRGDPTVSRGMKRASLLGFRRFVMINLFGFMSTDPDGLLTVEDPVGPENDAYILEGAKQATMLACGWGSISPLIPARAAHVVAMLQSAGVKLHALQVNKDGQPGHPLYLGYHLQPQEWRP